MEERIRARRKSSLSQQHRSGSLQNEVKMTDLSSEIDTPGWLKETEAGHASATDEDFSSDRTPPSTPFLQRAQSLSTVISLALSPVAIILVSVWANSLGGVSWAQGETKRVFNWHPVMMITAYALMNAGALMFRVSSTSAYHATVSQSEVDGKKRGIAKAVHVSTWSLSFIFGIVAMVAVFKSHNDPSGYIANLYSLHSWVGVAALTLYTLQFLVGIFAFGGFLSGSSNRLRTPLTMEIHKYMGTFIHLLATATILLGIQEKEGFVSCGYDVETADLMPWLNVGKIPYPCKISHSLGLVILGMGFFTSIGLAKFPVL